MPMHEDYMNDYNMDCGEYPMYPQMPGMGGMPGMDMPGMGMPGMGMPGMGMPGGYPGGCPMMPMPYPTMGEQDMKELCYMEHMNEYMAAMCQAEACKMRAMQCMHKG